MVDEVMADKAKIKVVVHKFGWINSEGHQSLQWSQYVVAAGKDPKGPRGGVNGMIKNGTWVSGRFRRYQDAFEWAARFAKKNGYALLSPGSQTLADSIKEKVV